MLIGGASLATLGALALQSEAIGELGRDPEREPPRARSCCCGAACSRAASWSRCRPSRASSTSACRSSARCCSPVLIMLAAGIGLVTARIYLGRGGALMAVLGFLVIRGLVALMVGVVWGQTTPHFPLYLVEALLVEAAFARAARALAGGHRGDRRRPDRHDRAGRGVGLEPRLDAAALDRLAAPRGRDRGLRRRPWPPGPSAGSSAASLRGRCARAAPRARPAAAAGPRWPACSCWSP